MEFLSELVYIHEERGLLFSRFELEVSGPVEGESGEESGDSYSITAKVWGEAYDPERHQLDSPVKAVTQHMLAVDRTEDGWETTIVMDT